MINVMTEINDDKKQDKHRQIIKKSIKPKITVKNMGEIKIKEKEVAVPGEVIAAGIDFLPSYGTYRKGEEIRALRMGIVRIEGKVIKLIPLSGRYMPKRGDTIIAKVVDILMSGWRMEMNSAYVAVLPLKDATSAYIEKNSDLTRYYALGDYVCTMITNVTSQKLVDITMRGPGLRKLSGGRIIEVNTNKVPRIIGKQGSMVTMIKNATGCRIVVGQNGLIWLEGEPEMENIAVEAIKKVEKEGHLSGLTDKVKEFLQSRIPNANVNTEPAHQENEFADGDNNAGGNDGYEQHDSRGFRERRGFSRGFRERRSFDRGPRRY